MLNIQNLPLHPMVVHFPIALGFLTPIIALFVWILIRKKLLQPRAWVVVVVLSVLYAGSAYLAKEMGGHDAHRVVKVLPKEEVKHHAEKGHWVFRVSLILLAASVVAWILPVVPWMQPLFILLAFIGIAPVMMAGYTGGELAYTQGAAHIFYQPNGVNSSQPDNQKIKKSLPEH